MQPRISSGIDEPIFIGIKTDLTGRDFGSNRWLGCSFNLDFSHGDGMGGLTEPQRDLYVNILEEIAESLRKGKMQTPGIVTLGN